MRAVQAEEGEVSPRLPPSGARRAAAGDNPFGHGRASKGAPEKCLFLPSFWLQAPAPFPSPVSPRQEGCEEQQEEKGFNEGPPVPGRCVSRVLRVRAQNMGKDSYFD